MVSKTIHSLRFNIFFQLRNSFNAYVGRVGLDLAYTQGDSNVISMPGGFRRHLVGKTLINVFHCESAEICFVSKEVIIQTFS